MAELPVMLDAINFVTAMSELPMRAATITFLEPDAMCLLLSYFVRIYGASL